MSRNQNSKRPYGVFTVEGEGESAFWTRIGAAWPNKDGGGFNVVLGAFPVNGRLVIRKPKAADTQR